MYRQKLAPIGCSQWSNTDLHHRESVPEILLFLKNTSRCGRHNAISKACAVIHNEDIAFIIFDYTSSAMMLVNLTQK